MPPKKVPASQQCHFETCPKILAIRYFTQTVPFLDKNCVKNLNISMTLKSQIRHSNHSHSLSVSNNLSCVMNTFSQILYESFKLFNDTEITNWTQLL